MKKFLAMLLVLSLSGAALIGCSTTDKTPDGNTPPAVTEETPKDGEEVAGEIAKIGLGQTTTIAKSKDLEGETTPVGQVDTVIVAAGFDKDGKVVKVTIDTAQTKINFDKELQLTTDVTEKGKTKVELGEAYGMKKASQIGKEWFEQAAALGEWMVGKTVAEIKAMEIKDGKTADAELTSSVTISVEGYITALEEAYNNAVEVKAGAVELGLGTDISAAKSKGYANADGKETLPLAQVDTIMTVVAFDKDGKVAGTIIDNAQTKVNFDKEGKVTSDKAAEVKTKVELGDEYGMKKASQIGKEWFEQAAALSEWTVGKTVEEIKAMELKDGKATDAELTSSVTITITDYIETIVEAKENAK
ncbi:hypothetical protein [Alkaliphilus oremlandii]|uniref:FMN-binding domain-containing protein n=1 Tax=Alkaliphilus oremlandii (strain OhILAs) TaxID=350688 RepID=A8MEV3_ALKOO|nr:hypothetical protein [Alkaliphilus oremlandii]ABW18432.1 conserved hypothetical protein [Alkaliphilus oremlandii OhILAs]